MVFQKIKMMQILLNMNVLEMLKIMIYLAML